MEKDNLVLTRERPSDWITLWPNPVCVIYVVFICIKVNEMVHTMDMLLGEFHDYQVILAVCRRVIRP